MYTSRTNTDVHSRHGRRPDMPPNDGIHQGDAQYHPKQDLFFVLQNSPNHMPFYPGGKKGMASSEMQQQHHQQARMGPRDDALGYRIRTLVREEMNDDNEEEEPSLAEVGFPGLNNILDRSMAIIARVIWVVIVVVCVVFCVYQVADRIALYFSYPVTANVRIVPNGTVKFPSFTLCGQDTTAIIAMKKQYLTSVKSSNNPKPEEYCNVTLAELVGFQQTNMYDVWQKSSVNQEFSEISFSLNIGNYEYVTRTESTMLYGVCTTFSIPGHVTYYGTATQLVIKRKNIGGCKKASYIITAQEDGHYADIKTSFTVTHGCSVGLSIQVKEFQAINTPTNPCISPAEYSQCVEECINKKILESVKCSLPYMRRSDLPKCTMGADAVEAYTLSESIMLSTDGTEDCKCTRKCRDTIYSITRESFIFDDVATKIFVYFSDNHFEVVSEDLSYVLVALLCDVGGNLGLYLGLSVLSVFEISQSIFEVQKKKALLKEAKLRHMK